MPHTHLALITGANKGIGFATARRLGAAGMRVLVGARDEGRGRAAVDSLTADGVDAALISMDVADPASVNQAAAEVERQFGQLDILVNNAGTGFVHRLPSELDPDELRTVLDTNLFGAMATTRAFLPLIRKSPAGRIVNVSSSLGSIFHLADPQWVAHQFLFTSYSISKAALNAYTALLAAELGQTGIKVNAVEPGYTVTDLTDQQGFQTAEEAAKVIVLYATIGPDGPTGGYFDIQGRIPW